MLGSSEGPSLCREQVRFWSKGEGKVTATATLPYIWPITRDAERRLQKVHRRQHGDDSNRITGRTPPIQNAPEIMTYPPRKDNNQAIKWHHHTDRLQNIGRGWRKKDVAAWNRPTRGITQAQMTAEPEVISNDGHTRQSTPASSSGQSTDKGWPRV